MKHKFDFSDVSMTGRFAYAVMCAERYAVSKYPDKDWKRLFGEMWKGTSEYSDTWYYKFSYITPEAIYEFDYYKAEAFPNLPEKDFHYYAEFYRDIDDNMKRLIEIPCEIPMVYP